MKFYQQWRGRAAAGNADKAWFKATVPGNIQYDYGVAHHFGDPNEGYHVEQYLPLEDCTFEYETALSFNRQPGETVWFCSGGIDYLYDIYLNQTKLYSYEGMYRPVELELTPHLTGSDTLRVVIHPHPKRPGAAAGTRQEADHSCKPPVCYGWDWNPRLMISGMWQEAYIETRAAEHITACEPFVRLAPDYQTAQVRFEIAGTDRYTITLQDREGNTVYTGTNPEFTVKNPQLWWCNGQGEPYLYRYTVAGHVNTVTGTLAFREVKVVRNTGANGPDGFPKSRYDAPTTVLLNGRRIFAKGSNWVNPELFWGNITAERYEELLELVRDANMNMLRIWGGAGMNKEAFYSACDRLGILVWQEFMLACNRYPDDPHYLAVLEQEATAMIKTLRRHPCLAIWCGGNELFNGWSGMDDQSLPLRLLDRLCYELDPGKPFFKTSPLIGMGHGCYAFKHPDMGGDIFESIRGSHLVAYTEFGVPGLTDVETLKTMMPENELFPVLRTKGWLLRHGLGAWGPGAWICENVLREYFGAPESIEDLVNWSNELQSTGYQAAFEEMRRQWPHCAMALNWCYNEPWSNAANNCLIDYPTKPKRAYYAVQRALRPVLFTAGMPRYDFKEGEAFSADIWFHNDTPQPATGTVTVVLKTGSTEKQLLNWSAEAGPNSNLQGPTVHFTLPESSEDFITLKLIAENGQENEYHLLLRHKKPTAKVKQMNA